MGHNCIHITAGPQQNFVGVEMCHSSVSLNLAGRYNFSLIRKDKIHSERDFKEVLFDMGTFLVIF